MPELEPIAAVGTPFGKGALCVVRLSGEGVLEIIERVFEAKSGKLRDRVATYGILRDPVTGETIDDGILTFYKGPRSYTGEDSAEFTGHGGIVVTHAALKAFLDAGARMAKPGEFSQRAFLAGKLSLLRAEGIVDLIDAKTDAAARLARRAADGSLERKLESIAQTLTALCAELCVLIDYPDQSLSDLDEGALRARMNDCAEQLDRLLSTFSASRAVTEGVKTYLVGRPNVGKSSLFNALLGEERAIVTEIEGTTRDVLEEQVRIGGILLRVLDTAGIREARDQIEKIGVERARQYAGDADLLLAVFDSSREPDENDAEILKLIRGRRALILLNKSDLPEKLPREELEKMADGIPVLPVSVRNMTGMRELEERIRAMFFGRNAAWNEELCLTNARHMAAVSGAVSALDEVENSINSGMTEDLYLVDFMDAYGLLGEIIGEEVGDDLVDNIFKKFCMGK